MNNDTHTIAELIPGAITGDLFFKNHILSWRTQGSHLSIFQHVSRMPESSRPYHPGDALNRIDWKYYARSDQWIVRQERTEAGARVVVAIDLSESMQWPLAETLAHLPADMPEVPSKVEIAIRTALEIVYQLLSLGDQVDLWVLEGVKDGSEQWHTRKIKSTAECSLLFAQWRAQKFDAAAILADFVSGRDITEKRYDVAVWAGDGLGAGNIQEFLKRGKQRIFCHILSSLELDPQWVRRDYCYFDEDSAVLEFQGRSLTNENFYDRTVRPWMAQQYEATIANDALYLRLSQQTYVAEFYRALCVGAHLLEPQP